MDELTDGTLPFPSNLTSKFDQSERGTPNNILKLTKFRGPLSKMMSEKVAALGSKYPDTFDWTIYDNLLNRFGENQPRGGVVFKSGLKLANFHSTCSRCHYALELDTYGRGCIHNCVYCYAKETLTQHGYWNQPMPFPLDLAELRKLFYLLFETDKPHKWRSVFEMKVPIRIGSMSDSFMFMDSKYGVTKELLKILQFYKYPFVAFTRSDLIARDDYLKLLDPSLASVQFSISGMNEKITKEIEPGAPSVARRLKALKTLNAAGIWTAVRLNPLFPTFPDGYFTDQASIRARFGNSENVPKFDLLDITDCDPFFEQLNDSKVNTLITGFVRLSKYSIISMAKASGVDLKPFFRRDIPQDARDKRYTDSEINYYYKVLQSKAARSGIRFSTCYIGNGIKDYSQYQSLWSNRSDCCDIKGNVAGFTKSAQDITWETRRLFAQSKEEFERGKEVDSGLESTTGLRTSAGINTESSGGVNDGQPTLA